MTSRLFLENSVVRGIASEGRKGCVGAPMVTSPYSSNAVARHYEPEDFRSFAHQELAVSTPWEQGICFLPECGRVFQPSRSWQIYCCSECERAGRNELRKWGHRMALSALIWRMGKYEQHDQGIRDLTRAARRHQAQVSSAWIVDRRLRAERGV